MRRIGLALILIVLAPSAGRGRRSPPPPGRRGRPAHARRPPDGHPQRRGRARLGRPADRAESPVPLYGKSWGRRPWAYALANQATPSAYWARLDQLGFGAGPIPGYTNGPGIGNIPSAPIGPDGGPAARPGVPPLGRPTVLTPTDSSPAP